MIAPIRVHTCFYRLNLHPNIYIFQHGCYLIIKKNLQFTLKIQEISVVTRRHGTVINTIYEHHQVLGLYETKILTRRLAEHNIICD